MDAEEIFDEIWHPHIMFLKTLGKLEIENS